MNHFSMSHEAYWVVAIRDLLDMGGKATALEVLARSRFDYGNTGPDAALENSVVRGMTSCEKVEGQDSLVFTLTDLGRGVASGKVAYTWSGEEGELIQTLVDVEETPAKAHKAPATPSEEGEVGDSAPALEEALGSSYLDTVMRVVEATAKYQGEAWRRTHPLSVFPDLGEICVTVSVGSLSGAYGLTLRELIVADSVVSAIEGRLNIEPLPLNLGDFAIPAQTQQLLGLLLSRGPVADTANVLVQHVGASLKDSLEFLETHRHYLHILARN